MSVTLRSPAPARLARGPGARRWLGLVVPAVLLIAWWTATRTSQYGLIPSPEEVISALADLAAGTDGDAFSGRLPAHILASVKRMYGAFVLACLAALPLGMLIRCSDPGARPASPPLEPNAWMSRCSGSKAWIKSTVRSRRCAGPICTRAEVSSSACSVRRTVANRPYCGSLLAFVTHALEEAILLADRVVIMSPGPGHIVADERIALSRPRDVASPEFNEIRRSLGAMLHSDHCRKDAA